MPGLQLQFPANLSESPLSPLSFSLSSLIIEAFVPDFGSGMSFATAIIDVYKRQIQDCTMLDNQLLIDYITDYLGGTLGSEYENPYGEGRIQIINSPEAQAAA